MLDYVETTMEKREAMMRRRSHPVKVKKTTPSAVAAAVPRSGSPHKQKQFKSDMLEHYRTCAMQENRKVAPRRKKPEWKPKRIKKGTFPCTVCDQQFMMAGMFWLHVKVVCQLFVADIAVDVIS